MTVGSYYDACPKCGSSESTQSTCRRLAMNGVDRCDRHGGKHPHVQAKLASENLERDARRLLAENGYEPVTNFLVETQQVVGEHKALKDALRAAVDELTALTVTDVIGRENVKAILDAYQRALADHARIVLAAGKLDIDKRLVRIEAELGQQIFDVVMQPAAAFIPAELTEEYKAAIYAHMMWTQEDPEKRGAAPIAVPSRRVVLAPEVTPAFVPSPPPVRPVEPLGLVAAPVVPSELVEPGEASESDVFDEPSEPVLPVVPVQPPPVSGLQVTHHDSESLREVFPRGRRGR